MSMAFTSSNLGSAIKAPQVSAKNVVRAGLDGVSKIANVRSGPYYLREQSQPLS